MVCEKGYFRLYHFFVIIVRPSLEVRDRFDLLSLWGKKSSLVQLL